MLRISVGRIAKAMKQVRTYVSILKLDYTRAGAGQVARRTSFGTNSNYVTELIVVARGPHFRGHPNKPKSDKIGRFTNFVKILGCKNKIKCWFPKAKNSTNFGLKVLEFSALRRAMFSLFTRELHLLTLLNTTWL